MEYNLIIQIVNICHYNNILFIIKHYSSFIRLLYTQFYKKCKKIMIKTNIKKYDITLNFNLYFCYQ